MSFWTLEVPVVDLAGQQSSRLPDHWQASALPNSHEAAQTVYDENAQAPKSDENGELGQRIEALAGEVKERLEGTSVYLVGMMGSGKSTVGKMVGGALNYPFLDTDSLIESSAKCSIPEIFASDGEDAFRELETQVLQQLMPHKEVVVATGGGAVVRAVNWGYLHHGIVVWLDGPPELLARRAVGDGTAKRPMLAQGGAAAQEGGGEYEAMVARIQCLLQQRGERYAAADLRVSLAAGPGAAPDTGAPAAVVTWRLLHALNERLKADAAERKAASEAEITITQEGLPPGMRVVPPVDREGAAPAA
ncbi:hypothetical protein WJX81_007558 [Elliptochloris bilobata]|uniref:shikimate kinase n=1 Tax=Elliptochloris bilobata TaxID=381761 RepID=A0AAW1QHH8_9CHLO